MPQPRLQGKKCLHREWITHVCPVRPHLSEWITHVCPVRPHLSEWITHVCPDVRPHLSEWITHVCPDVHPHLFENLLYKVYMIVFTCFLRNSNSINEVGLFSPEWYQKDFRGTVYHCQSELGLCWSPIGVLSLRYSSRDHSSSPCGGMPINVS